MTNLVSPEGRITLAGTEYVLDCSFSTLRAVEQAFKEDVVAVQQRILDMPVSDIARLIATATPLAEDEAGQLLLDEVDVTGVEYRVLKARLMGWLAIALAPKADRGKKAEAVAAMLDRLTAKPPSRGKNTKASASAS